MAAWIGVYLVGLGVAGLWANGAMLWLVVKHNRVPDWEVIVKEWGLALLWPFTLSLAAWVWTLEGIRYMLHGKE